MTRCVLPFQKIWDQFPAPKPGSSQPQQFHSRRIWGLCPLWTPARLCTHSLFSICPVSNHSYDVWSPWRAWTFVSSHCVKTMFLGAIGVEVWQAVGEEMIRGVSLHCMDRTSLQPSLTRSWQMSWDKIHKWARTRSPTRFQILLSTKLKMHSIWVTSSKVLLQQPELTKVTYKMSPM